MLWDVHSSIWLSISMSVMLVDKAHKAMNKNILVFSSKEIFSLLPEGYLQMSATLHDQNKTLLLTNQMAYSGLRCHLELKLHYPLFDRLRKHQQVKNGLYKTKTIVLNKNKTMVSHSTDWLYYFCCGKPVEAEIIFPPKQENYKLLVTTKWMTASCIENQLGDHGQPSHWT